MVLFLLSGSIQTSLQASQPSCTEGKCIVDYAIKYVGTNKYVGTWAETDAQGVPPANEDELLYCAVTGHWNRLP